MLRLDDHEAWRVRAAEIAESVNQGQQVMLRASETSGRERLVARLLDGLTEPVHVVVPVSADQPERVLLAIGAALGCNVQRYVSDCLSDPARGPGSAVVGLDEALGARPVVVEGWDRLGDLGNDDLRAVLGERSRAVSGWLTTRASVAVTDFGDPGLRQLEQLPDGQPITLMNGVQNDSVRWDRFAPDAEAYRLALMQVALGESSDTLTSGGHGSMRERVFELLPLELQTLLLKLGVHARPMALVHWGDRDKACLAMGRDLGLWTETSAGVTVTAAWSRWCRERLKERVRDLHLGLATMFAASVSPTDGSAGTVGLDLLEAHRHYVLAGDFERALEFARYGAGLLVQAARDLSIHGKHFEAAHLYERVLDTRGERFPLDEKLIAYARHYRHFNRARAAAESLPQTEAGYREALKGWPSNALFHSRLIRVLFIMGREADALDALEAGRNQVPPHPEKNAVLIARTVGGLLGRKLIVPAIQVWGDHLPDTFFAKAVFESLREALREGWYARRLVLEPDEPLHFHRDVSLRVVAAGAEWVAEIPELTHSARDASPLAAVTAMVRELRRLTARMVREYTTDLGANDRLRKRMLLATIDVPASRLDGAHPDSYWVMGRLERTPDHALWLRTGGIAGASFEVPGAMAREVRVGDLMHLARVGVDARGTPVGPVLELEPGFRGDEDELWERWRRRAGGADAS